jgi:hypothetical protein
MQRCCCFPRRHGNATPLSLSAQEHTPDAAPCGLGRDTSTTPCVIRPFSRATVPSVVFHWSGIRPALLGFVIRCRGKRLLGLAVVGLGLEPVR